MLKKLLQSMNERPVAFQPIYIEITGSLAAGYLLSQIIYWYYKMGGEFYKIDSEWIEELHIGEKALRNAKSTLKKLGFVTIKARGNPPITHYNINEDLLLEYLTKKEDFISPKGQNENSPKGEIDFAQKAILKTPKGRNRFRPKGTSLITETTTETTTESIAKAIEQSSDDFLDYQKIDEKNLEEKNRENKDFSIPEENKSSGPDFFYMLSVQIIHTITKGLEYGELEITMMHKFLLQCVGIDEFKESRKWQRAYAKHLVNWTKKNGKDELMTRMKGILEDPFKAKNCNSIAYFYNELKAYIHSPVVIPQKKSSNVTFG